MRDLEYPTLESLPNLYTQGSLVLSMVFNIWHVCETTEFLKVDGASALGLFGALDSSVCCEGTVKLYESPKKINEL